MKKQEAIEKIKNMETSNIISQIDEQLEVVIPQFVSDWIEWSKRSDWDLQDLFLCLEDGGELDDWTHDENDDLIPEKVDMIARAWFAYPNITVEKEKLYTVKIADAFLTKITRGRERNVKYRMLPYKDVYNVFNDGIYDIFLTETEIKQADERLWQFAEPVGDE